MLRRHIEARLRAAMADTPVLLLHGARQTGKSTLAANLIHERGEYVSLDDATTLAAVQADASGFVRGLEGLAVIDEVQKAPEVFPAIKREVDAHRQPGRFLLTGSADVLLLPQLSESLAGRMEICTLWPFSQGELQERREHFIDGVFSESLPRRGKMSSDTLDLRERLPVGGYPEAVQRRSPSRRAAWFASYITTMVQRDVRDLANIEGLTDLPRLLQLLAARVSGLLNMSELSRASAIPQSTLKRYVALLETTFLLQLLPAWSTNCSKRLIKSPKIHLLDSGLTAHLSGITPARMKADPVLLGPLLETFVVAELRKQATWAETSVSLFHYRTATGREVDVVLEDAQGRIVGIEVKGSGTVRQQDFGGLESLAEDAGKQFFRGLVLYTGDQRISFGERLVAMPVSTLWHM